MHVVALAAPTTAEYLPAEHDTHAAELSAEAVVEYLPASQLVHVSDPGAAQLPSWHVPTTTLVGESTVSVTSATVCPMDAVEMLMVSLAPEMSYVAVV